LPLRFNCSDSSGACRLEREMVDRHFRRGVAVPHDHGNRDAEQGGDADADFAGRGAAKVLDILRGRGVGHLFEKQVRPIFARRQFFRLAQGNAHQLLGAGCERDLARRIHQHAVGECVPRSRGVDRVEFPGIGHAAVDQGQPISGAGGAVVDQVDLGRAPVLVEHDAGRVDHQVGVGRQHRQDHGGEQQGGGEGARRWRRGGDRDSGVKKCVAAEKHHGVVMTVKFLR
jgi:hypothetical protein